MDSPPQQMSEPSVTLPMPSPLTEKPAFLEPASAAASLAPEPEPAAATAQPEQEPSRKGIAGLTNIGNTCYGNAVIRPHPLLSPRQSQIPAQKEGRI